MDQVTTEEAPAGLADVEAQAEALGAAPRLAREEAQQEQARAAEATAAAELLAALQMARMIASPAFAWWPEFGAVWSDRQLDAIASAGAAVMERHGLTMGELMSTWGPYVALVGATAGPSLATYAAIKGRKHAPQQQHAPQQAAGADC